MPHGVVVVSHGAWRGRRCRHGRRQLWRPASFAASGCRPSLGPHGSIGSGRGARLGSGVRRPSPSPILSPSPSHGPGLALSRKVSRHRRQRRFAQHRLGRSVARRARKQGRVLLRRQRHEHVRPRGVAAASGVSNLGDFGRRQPLALYVSGAIAAASGRGGACAVGVVVVGAATGGGNSAHDALEERVFGGSGTGAGGGGGGVGGSSGAGGGGGGGGGVASFAGG